MMVQFAANWRKSVSFIAIGMSVLVAVLSAVHIWGPQIPSVIGASRFFLIVISGLVAFSAIKPDFFDNFFQGVVTDNELFQKIAQMGKFENLTPAQVTEFKAVANANRSLLTYDWKKSGAKSPLHRAVLNNRPQLVAALLECGADPFETMEDKTGLDMASEMLSRGLAPVFANAYKKYPAEKLAHHGINRATVAIVCGDMTMLKTCTKAEMERKSAVGRQAIHDAVSFRVPVEFIQVLIDAGVNLNEPLLWSSGKANARNYQIVSQMAANLASNANEEATLIAILQSGRAKITTEYPACGDAVFCAIGNGLIKAIKLMETTYDWSTINEGGKTALDAATSSKSLAMYELVQKNMQSRGLINSASNSAGPAQSATKSAAATSAGSMIANRAVTLDEIETNVSMSLSSLVEMDSFAKDLAQQLHDFISEKPKQSRGIVVWGDASVGKSSIGKSLSGFLADQGTPGLEIPELPFEYHSLADGKSSLPEIIEKAAAGSVLFVDEIDKFFDPSSNMVSDQEAMKIKTQIITNWDRKPIFWIFAGSFIKLRGKGPLNKKMILDLLGAELNSRLAFNDWKIGSWTADKIYAAASLHITHDFGDNFDNNSVQIICEKALEADGGFREFEKHAKAIYRRAQKQGGADAKVTEAITNEYFKQLEGHS
ncbi:hypothetical protein BH10BDE1_BH10BDE1_16890 [soil metagenome]